MHQGDGIPDSKRSADLSRIQTAILDYYGQHRQLPAALTDLHVELTDKVNDYEYSFDKQQVGGPTTSFTLCAMFSQPGLVANRTNLAPGVDFIELPSDDSAYMYHRSGRQCFSHSQYKGQMHIAYILNATEIIPIPTYVTDFAALTATAWSFYSAQAKVLGINPSQSDLSKSCSQRDQASDAPDKKAFSCGITVRKYNRGVTDKNQGLAMLDDLSELLSSQGFQKPSTNEYRPFLPGQPSDAYSKTMTTQGSGCRLEINFTPKAWGIDYSMACGAKDTAKVPDGFRLNEK
jgi:hypothetical protein